MTLCPCCSEKPFENCCGPIIEGKSKAHSPEQLMRSRFTAYTLCNSNYIFQTYSKQSQLDNTVDDIDAWAKQVEFIKLDITNSDDIALNNHATGQVEFIAHYLYGNEYHQLHELSDFIVENNEWKYHSGTIFERPSKILGRNDICPCGSEKKFKKCHGK
ncbi:YchJ family protein [Flocculibacter collagenilyticus]|uniref:YchJ family protein n=1 Tax=Flocculibacter collagenilyticus TaxID=2744479 RepID=UPI0018F379DF|nr:YchJ family metal-binding protein [Flocculibacter collagenilyticus]